MCETCGEPSVRIRPMMEGDVAEVTDIHLRAFGGFFLTFLGERFLRLLYGSVLGHPDGVGLVATAGPRLVGFAAGVSEQEGFYRWLLRRRKWRFAAASAPALLRRPTAALRLARALRQPKTAGQSAAPACLMSIAVDPAANARGIGGLLLDAFCQAMRERDATAISLTTDAEGNEKVNDFYRKRGFALARSFRTPEGRMMNEYVRTLRARDLETT